MAKRRIIHSVIRGAGLFGAAGRRANKALTAGQPLMLVREPTNRVDANAIVVGTLLGQSVGYVAREDAVVLAPEIDAGKMWLAQVRGRRPWLLLWRDDGESKREDEMIVDDFRAELRRRAEREQRVVRVGDSGVPHHVFNCRCVIAPVHCAGARGARLAAIHAHLRSLRR